MVNTNKFFKTSGIIISGALAIGLVVFTAFFVYYLWQFKFGNPEKMSELDKKYNIKFTSQTTDSDSLSKSEKPADEYIRKNNSTRGNLNSNTSIIAFIDFECPYCRADYEQLKRIIQKYEPATKITVKHLPFTNLHPNSMKSALASTCAAEQNKFWEYYELLINEPIDDTVYLNYAQILNLDTTQFSNCFNSEKYQPSINQDMLDAVEIGVRGTPTYLINHDVIEGIADNETWDKIILQNL